MSNWSDLPVEILNLIVERVCYIDQTRCRAVCKSWRSNIDKDIKYLDNLPWMISFHTNSEKIIFDCLFYMYQPSQMRGYIGINGFLVGARLHASKFGWLLLSKRLHLNASSRIGVVFYFFFFCPFTGEVVQLPDLYRYKDVTATFSAAPTSPNCLIFVIGTGNDTDNLSVSICSLRYTTWCTVQVCPLGERSIYDVAYAEGVFYVGFSSYYETSKAMGAYKPASQEWKLYPYPQAFQRHGFFPTKLIDSPDYGNLILLSQSAFNGKNWAFRFDPTSMKWHRIENFLPPLDICSLLLIRISDERGIEPEVGKLLSDRILFCSNLNSISMAAEREASKVANTIQWSEWSDWSDRSDLSDWSPYENRRSYPQICNWVSKELRAGTNQVWIQPPQPRTT